MTEPSIRVAVREDTETLATTVSRDDAYGWYELPLSLVVQFEAASDEFARASEAINDYITDNGLEPNYEEF
jgi:hypothetical protein